ncbi:MAG: insulinase family protein [Cytophagaceae bacterium]|nr:insulinase family protein [Cytophagaceae bacterium]MDW8455552.1 pitrilysin family protein [Cytophagaceae bacterium]
MIPFEHFILKNGLEVYVHEDHSNSIAVLNLLYRVGSRDEDPDKTGFAHLFEHLMFGGSKHIPNYDLELQRVGGENNAFTSPDITNYYITLPSANLETAFWLESDRMLSLSFDPQVLHIQQNVVVEEYKQRYLNQPYGDAWLRLRPLAYTVHPYRWPTIGKDISHIEHATMDDVKNFFYTYYIPNNAILVVAGNVHTKQVVHLAEKWFEPIPPGRHVVRNIPAEPPQIHPRKQEAVGDVPAHAIFKAYHMCGRTHARYNATELMCDLLGRGKSSRLYQSLVKEKKIFSSLHAYTTSSVDPGLLVIEGKLNKGYTLEQADAEIQALTQNLIKEGPSQKELQRAKNQSISTLEFGEVEILERAMAIAFAANLGDANLVNLETNKIESVNVDDINSLSAEILREDNCSTLYYRSATST